MLKPFIRVRSKITRHQFDIHRNSFNPAKHELVKRYPPASAPRRPKLHIDLKASGAKPVEGVALPSSTGTGEKEVEP
jgi:hypothetical protein